MSAIEIKVPVTLTLVVDSDNDHATTSDVAKWVNENHGDVRRSIESAMRIRDDHPRMGYLDNNYSVYLMGLVEVDAQIPRTWGVTTIEWSES